MTKYVTVDLEAFLTKIAHWQMGDPTDEQTRRGPMSSVAGRDELAEQVDDAIAKGAVVHADGKVPDGEGAFYPPTVLSAVTRRCARSKRSSSAGRRAP